MKLRIKGNAIRLRISRSELTQFNDQGHIEDAVAFGEGTDARLAYVLKRDSKCQNIEAVFADNTITVRVPEAIARTWSETDRVGIEATQSAPENSALHILIEKDFQCLHQRPGEDESDHFPHPEAALFEEE